MQQNATLLTPAQEKALTALLAGKRLTDAAAEAGIDRTTLWRWLKDDLAFQARFNAERRELCRVVQARLTAIAEKAATTVENAIANGDVKSALTLLRGLGLLTGDSVKIGSDDPRDLADSQAANENIRKLSRCILSA